MVSLYCRLLGDAGAGREAGSMELEGDSRGTEGGGESRWPVPFASRATVRGGGFLRFRLRSWCLLGGGCDLASRERMRDSARASSNKAADMAADDAE